MEATRKCSDLTKTLGGQGQTLTNAPENVAKGERNVPTVALQSSHSLAIDDLVSGERTNRYIFSQAPSGLYLPAGVGSVALAPTVVEAPESRNAEPTQTHRYLAQGLVQLAGEQHFLKPKLDDPLSEKIFDRFMEAIDPNEALFLKSEVAELEQLRTKMDDILLNSYLEPLFKLWEMSQQRQAMLASFSGSIIDDVVDAIDPEAKPDASKESQRPTTSEEQVAEWKKGVEGLATYFLAQGESKPAVKARLRDIYSDSIEKTESMTGKEKSDAAFDVVMDSFLEALDPHSSYISPSELKDFTAHLSGEMVGIGVVLKNEYRANADGEYVSHIVIQKAMDGGPSNGILKDGDAILEITDAQGKWHSMLGVSMKEAIDQYIKGDDGAPVSMRVRGKDDPAPREVTIVRGQVTMDNAEVETGIVNLDNARPGAPSRVGVIHLPQFFHGEHNSAAAAVAKAIEEVKAQGVDALVFDLRNNGGGDLRDALRIAGLFIPEGPVTQTKEASGKVEVLNDPDPAQQYAGPLAVLVNRYSASASEIVAAALQDYGRAVIMGERTHGKGSVQQIQGLGIAGEQMAIKLTTSTFHRVNGGTTQKHGVLPDIDFGKPGEAEYGERKYPTALDPVDIPAATYLPTGDVVSILAGQKKTQPVEKKASEAPANETLQERIDRKGDDWLARAAELLSEMFAPTQEAEADEARAVS